MWKCVFRFFQVFSDPIHKKMKQENRWIYELQCEAGVFTTCDTLWLNSQHYFFSILGLFIVAHNQSKHFRSSDWTNLLELSEAGGNNWEKGLGFEM